MSFMGDPSEVHSSNTTVTKDDDEAELTRTIRPGLYGWGKFHPRWLQAFNKPGWLLACLCFAVFSSTLAGALMPAVTDTLERILRMNSLSSGLLNSSYDIASLCIVLFVCHYGERSHKGKWIGIGAIVYGIGSCILTIPHYLSETYNPHDQHSQHNATCPADYPQDICGVHSSPQFSLSWSYYIMLAGQSVRGIGGTCLGTLMLAYVDENVSQRNSPFYLSIISVVGLVAMALGYLIGGQLLNLYGDFDKVPRDKWPKPGDAGWFGCWWLGYYVAGISAFLVSVPLLGFPNELPSKIQARQMDQIQSHGEAKVTGTGFGQNWSQIPRMTWSLLKNPVFTCFTVRTTLEVMFGSGWATFMPKFLQNMYGIDPSTSAMVSGVICLGPIMCGTLLGGWIIKKFNWKVRGVLFFGFLATVAGSFSSLGILFTCPTRRQIGANVDYTARPIIKDSLTLYDTCNSNCSCPTTDYTPVCFENMHLTYYSPCFAGCKEIKEEGSTVEFTECECLTQHFSSLVNANSSVRLGECPQTAFCIRQRNWFVGLWIITCLLYGVSGMPLIQSFLRAVPFSQRTLALGLQSVPLRLLGTVPGPILMGFMFDYSCILWKRHCNENLSCLQYDNETLVRLLVYSGIFFRVASGGLLIVAIVLYRPPKQKYRNGDVTPAVEADEDEREHDGSILDMLVERVRRRNSSETEK